jgi:quercetin dioxygenase-like cupin family protein
LISFSIQHTAIFLSSKASLQIRLNLFNQFQQAQPLQTLHSYQIKFTLNFTSPNNFKKIIMASPFPAPRIVIASHNDEGKSFFARDAQAPLFGPFGPTGSQFTTLFTTDTEPANNNAELPALITSAVPRPGPKGSYFGTSDMPPGTVTPFHRTITLDYGVVLKGEIVARLNNGVEKTIKEGEMMVQMGTIHSWHNVSDQWCRMLFVMLPAEKVVTKDGRVLEEAFFPVKPAQ